MRIANRSIVNTAFVLAMLVPCVAPYAHAQSSIGDAAPQYADQAGNVDDARRTVLSLVKPPNSFFEIQGQNENFDDMNSFASLQRLDHVSLRRTELVIFGNGKQYRVSLATLTPVERLSRAGWPDVYLNDSLALYAVSDSNPPVPNEDVARRLVAALLVLKAAALAAPAEQNDEATFQESARAYRAATVKPQLPEEARRFSVQAMDAFNDKDFDSAVDLYGRALMIVPWWPEGHFNRALLFSQIDDFDDAIVEMKRYLALVPDAPNARAAQDKIYGWERKASPAN